MQNPPENKMFSAIRIGPPRHPECPPDVQGINSDTSPVLSMGLPAHVWCEANPPSRQYYDDESPGKPTTRPR